MKFQNEPLVVSVRELEGRLDTKEYDLICDDQTPEIVSFSKGIASKKLRKYIFKEALGKNADIALLTDKTITRTSLFNLEVYYNYTLYKHKIR